MLNDIKRIINLILLVCLIGVSVFASGLNEKQYSFDHISFNEGLSQVTVTSIYQDKKGFIWIGTFDGLNRYDGKDFIVYRHDSDIPGSISNSFIQEILEDKEGDLWVGTSEGGLNRFDRKNNVFIHYKNIKGVKDSLSNNSIRSLFEDSEGNIWVGTRNGLNLLKKKEGKFKRFMNISNSKNSINGEIVKKIIEDKEGFLWIGTKNGLIKFNRITEKSIVYKNFSDNKDIIANIVTSLYFDKSNDLWIGTWRNGIFKFNERDGTFIKYNLNKKNSNKENSSITGIIDINDNEILITTNNDGIKILNKTSKQVDAFIKDQKKSDSLNSNSFLDVYKDRNGLIWMGTADKGINIYVPERTRFLKKNISVYEKNYKNHNVVWRFIEENENILWIITGSGLVKYDNIKNKYTPFYIKKDLKVKNTEVSIVSVLDDSNGVFWIGTSPNGMYTFDKKKNKFFNYNFVENYNTLLKTLIIKNGIEDSKGNLWFTTNQNGVIKINKERNKLHNVTYDPEDINSIGNNITSVIKEGKSGMIWIGTFEGGLNRLDPKTKKIKRYMKIPGDKASINSNTVLAIRIGDDNIIWVGTTNGFSKFDTKKEVFYRYTNAEGYLNQPVYEIIEDNNLKIWLAGNRLSRFDPITNDFIFFNKRNGLVDGEFNSGAALKSKYNKNIIYFGSTEGYNIIDTNNIKINLHAPSIVFTKIKINGKEFKPGSNSFLKDDISESNEITLPYKLNNVMLHFNSLDFSNSTKNKYSYKIKGINKEWIHLGNSNEVVLTNLAPGEYRLLVRGSNNAGIWSEKAAELTITILAPFWATLWFKGILIIIILLILIQFFRMRTKSLESKYEKENAINKIMFKYNISKREREVIDLVVKGKSSREIENELYISLSTVNNHIYSILRKMRLKNRGELIVLIKTTKVS